MATRRKRRSKAPDHVTSTLRLDDAKPFQEEVARSVRSAFRPVLVVMNGAHAGNRVSVEGSVLVGRDPDAELNLTDAGVSWHHAQIEDRGGSFAIVDTGSTNGTTVNGETVEEKVLTRGDKITFGTTLVRYDVQDEADQAYDAFLERLLTIDDLSGLYLRRRFDSELGALLANAGARGSSVAMLVMDLDGVKKINDTHGHVFGAYTIGEAGKIIGRLIEGKGIACRWGGDEYLAALNDCGCDAGVDFGETIRKAVADHRFEHDEIELHPGISIGVAAYPEHAKDAHALFRAADQAMYRAKTAGKNRVSR